MLRANGVCRLLAIAGVLLATSAAAQSPDGPTQPAAPTPVPQSSPAGQDAMRFQLVREGPAEACGSRCREWVSASGQIVATTARTFGEFSSGKDLRGAVVVMESNGGSVGASLTLGQMFRRLGVTTTVGRTTKLQPDADGTERATLSGRAVCASACVFAFLGGAHRNVPLEARLFVHQIWPVNKREDAMGTTYSAVEMVRVQRELGVVARHIVEMGGHISLFETSMRIPPWEQIKALNREDIKRMGLHTAEDPFAVPRPTTPAASVPVTAPSSTSAVSEQGGWTSVAQGSAQNVVRKHILTMEGDPIGSFELSLACGSSAGNYTVAYNETRRSQARAGSGGVADRLRAVVVAQSQTERVYLKIENSTVEGGSSELKTVARGEISDKILAGLSKEKGGLLVATQTVGNARTVIRVGNTGFADAFKKTLATCGT